MAPHHGWVPLHGGRDDRTEGRVFDERVSAMISPGPGGRWETWVLTDGRPTQGPLAASADDARVRRRRPRPRRVDDVGRRSPRPSQRDDPGPRRRRHADPTDLDRLLGARLADARPCRADVAGHATGPARRRCSAQPGAVGPATVIAVLHHEGVDAATVAGLVPAIGLPIPDAVRELHDRWGMDRLNAGAHLSATPDDLRAAGCTTVEMLQAAPREVLRQLDTRTHTWELAAHSLLEAGMSPREAVRQLALHAPTPDTFAAGVYEIQPARTRLSRRRARSKRARSRRPLGALRPLPRRDGRDPQHRLRHPGDARARRPRPLRRRHARNARGLRSRPAPRRRRRRALVDDPVVDQPRRRPYAATSTSSSSCATPWATPSDSSASTSPPIDGLVAALDAAGARRDDLGLERDGRE